MKLKTLKELPPAKLWIIPREGMFSPAPEAVDREELRAEAIRHIDELMHSEIPLTCIYAVKEWIMEFFNLTEEDLK